MFEREPIAAGEAFLDKTAGLMCGEGGHILARGFCRIVDKVEDDAVLDRILVYTQQFAVPGGRFGRLPVALIFRYRA